jgi:MATE family, multidrug efflux pump
MEQTTDNSIVTEAVVPLFFRYAIPAIVGLLAASSAGVVDGIFVGNYVGSNALAALNLTIPIGALCFGISLMLAVGGTVMAGKYQGDKLPGKASAIFSKSIMVIVIASLGLCSLMLVFLEPLVGLLGANEELFPFTYDYLAILLVFEPFLIIGFALSYFVRVDGRPNLAGASLLGSAIVNIVLDWLFIVRLGWGIEGAAWATGISFVVMFLIIVPHFFSRACTLVFSMHQTRWGEVGRAAINGVSEFVNEISAGITTFMFNWVMITRLGTDGVAAFAVMNYTLFVGLMISYAISDSLQPLISTNLGARRAERIGGLLRIALTVVSLIGAMVIALLLLAPGFIIVLFLEEESTTAIQITTTFIHWFWPAYLFNGANIALSAYFTAMHKPYHSAAIALSRSLVLPVPFLLGLPHFLGDVGIYVAIPLAEFLSLVLALYFYRANRPATLVYSEIKMY